MGNLPDTELLNERRILLKVVIFCAQSLDEVNDNIRINLHDQSCRVVRTLSPHISACKAGVWTYGASETLNPFLMRKPIALRGSVVLSLYPTGGGVHDNVPAIVIVTTSRSPTRV
ncbi:hypothetical protein Acr_05g0015790 [Actinidia rufa]|uniref:Uncharacterized protein n=1 Tax=Actinidia rufa TaxID=165716 RepID=A0A7J0ENU8_9ERIC|nr:hypothetical protein Acr_05g0015790 [Actinidia rufa]